MNEILEFINTGVSIPILVFVWYKLRETQAGQKEIKEMLTLYRDELKGTLEEYDRNINRLEKRLDTIEKTTDKNSQDIARLEGKIA